MLPCSTRDSANVAHADFGNFTFFVIYYNLKFPLSSQCKEKTALWILNGTLQPQPPNQVQTIKAKQLFPQEWGSGLHRTRFFGTAPRFVLLFEWSGYHTTLNGGLSLEIALEKNQKDPENQTPVRVKDLVKNNFTLFMMLLLPKARVEYEILRSPFFMIN